MEDGVICPPGVLPEDVAASNDHPPTIDEVEEGKVRIRQGKHADLRPDAQQTNREREQAYSVPLKPLDVRADERRAPDQLTLEVHPQPGSASGATSLRMSSPKDLNLKKKL